MLYKISWCKPQAAYSGFIKGFKHKPISDIKNQLKQSDDFRKTEFIPAITGEIN